MAREEKQTNESLSIERSRGVERNFEEEERTYRKPRDGRGL